MFRGNQHADHARSGGVVGALAHDAQGDLFQLVSLKFGLAEFPQGFNEVIKLRTKDNAHNVFKDRGRPLDLTQQQLSFPSYFATRSHSAKEVTHVLREPFPRVGFGIIGSWKALVFAATDVINYRSVEAQFISEMVTNRCNIDFGLRGKFSHSDIIESSLGENGAGCRK